MIFSLILRREGGMKGECCLIFLFYFFHYFPSPFRNYHNIGMPFKKHNKFGCGRGVRSDSTQECEDERGFEKENVEKRKRMSFDGHINMTMPKKKKAKPTVIHKRKTLESDIAPEIKTTKYRQGRHPPRKEYEMKKSLEDHGILAPQDARRKSLQAKNFP